MFGHAEHRGFLKCARLKAADLEHHQKILKAIASYDSAVSAMKVNQFFDWGKARTVAAEVKRDALRRLPQLLEEFAANAAANGIEVIWAGDARQANTAILRIAREHQVRKVVKSKSMTTEEIGINEELAASGVEVWETDLGELIVQLAGERPYHIVTPAMHKSRSEIGELFNRTLGIPITDNAEELTAAARKHLREAFVTAEMGITGANFLIASTGAVVLTENEGNARLTTSCPQVHVVVAGIEKILARLEDLELFLPLLATSGTGQQYTCYNSIIRGPRRPGEPDGPEKMYVVLLDNGRSSIYSDAKLQVCLTCIRCGACLNACPVYRTIGGHSYNTSYPGPIGAVITPHMRGFEDWQHLSSASSLCGACSEVCPVHIDLHRLLLENRWTGYRKKTSSPVWVLGFRLWAFFCRQRVRLQLIRPFLFVGSVCAGLLLPGPIKKRIPRLARRSFSELWQEHERQREHT